MLNPKIYDAAEAAGYSHLVLAMESAGSQGIDKGRIIELLNLDITHQYASAIQYNQHAATIVGAEWLGVIDNLKGHATDDFQQAQELADKVSFLGGMPTVAVAEIKQAIISSPRDTLVLDLETQRAALERFRERVPQLMVVQEYGLVEYYQDLMVHEAEHLNFLEVALQEGKASEGPVEMGTPKGGPVQEILDSLRQKRMARQASYKA